MPSRFSCKSAQLCFAFLPPPLPERPHPQLAMQTVRTITAPAGTDLNFAWEVKYWVRIHE